MGFLEPFGKWRLSLCNVSAIQVIIAGSVLKSSPSKVVCHELSKPQRRRLKRHWKAQLLGLLLIIELFDEGQARMDSEVAAWLVLRLAEGSEGFAGRGKGGKPGAK